MGYSGERRERAGLRVLGGIVDLDLELSEGGVPGKVSEEKTTGYGVLSQGSTIEQKGDWSTACLLSPPDRVGNIKITKWTSGEVTSMGQH